LVASRLKLLFSCIESTEALSNFVHGDWTNIFFSLQTEFHHLPIKQEKNSTNHGVQSMHIFLQNRKTPQLE
jgi:hypothetical protein